MKKPWFKRVTFWTGLLASVVLAGPFGAVGAALWCAGYAINSLRNKNKQQNTYNQAPIQQQFNAQQSSDHNGAGNQQQRKQGEVPDQQQQAPYNPYHTQSSSIAPQHTPNAPSKGGKIERS